MQSNALPAFDDEHWRSLTQDMRWLPDPSDGDYDYNQFMDFEQPEFYDAPTSTAGFGALDKAEYLDQWSAYSSQQAAPEPTLISVSSVFNLDRLDADGSLPDFDLVANDGVHFAVNAAKLRASSFSEFGGMAAYARLGAAVPLSSTILNLLLHAVYGLSATSYSPTLDDLGAYTTLCYEHQKLTLFDLQPQRSTRSNDTDSPRRPSSASQSRRYSKRSSAWRHRSRSNVTRSPLMQGLMSSPSPSRHIRSPFPCLMSSMRKPSTWARVT